MNGLLTFGDQLARESAEWYPIFGDFKNKKKIAVQNMNETRDNWGKIGENFAADSHTITLRTRYQYDYSPPTSGERTNPTTNETEEFSKIQHILYRGRWYEIQEVRPHELGNFGLVKQKEYYLILFEVEYGRDYEGQG